MPSTKASSHSSPQTEAAGAHIEASVMATGGVLSAVPAAVVRLHANPLVGVPGHNIEQATDKGADS